MALFGAAYGVPWLVERCRQSNPSLTGHQLLQLEDMLGNACRETMRPTGRDLATILRPIVALAVPNGELAYELLFSILRNLNATPKVKVDPVQDEDGERVAEALRSYGCVDAVLGRVQGFGVRQALLAALRAKPSPTCPITLDELLVDGVIDRDVGMIVQGSEKHGVHVFLYRRSALERWFADSHHNNPLTRQPVDTLRDYFPLS
jgi:hypothetical protein